MKKIITILSFFIGILFLPGITSSAQAQDVVVIVNKANPIGDMTAGKVKLYYLRKIKKRWPGNNLSIKLVTIKGNSGTKNAFLEILGMADTEMSQYFSQRQFANAEAPPKVLANYAAVIKYVSETEGAMGYISKVAYDAASSRVKVVFTQ